jgi:6-phosphogluconate dehydrogenase
MEVTPEKVGTADVGIVGIGTMGSNLALNMLDREFDCRCLES